MKSEKLLIGNEKEIVLLIIFICNNEFCRKTRVFYPTYVVTSNINMNSKKKKKIYPF